jgi:hypothetical protein
MSAALRPVRGNLADFEQFGQHGGGDVQFPPIEAYTEQSARYPSPPSSVPLLSVSAVSPVIGARSSHFWTSPPRRSADR